LLSANGAQFTDTRRHRQSLVFGDSGHNHGDAQSKACVEFFRRTSALADA
jgi:hypothetical protein